jgi:hypothetical protein
MNEQALRAMVREAVARHLAQTGHATATPGASGLDEMARRHHLLPMTDHPSHYRYGALPESSGPCYIEPGVTCSHCGFCESHGH